MTFLIGHTVSHDGILEEPGTASRGHSPRGRGHVAQSSCGAFLHRVGFGLAILACLFTSLVPLPAQVPETRYLYIRIGTLQSRFSACGAERAWNDVYYEGLQWPADYNYTDNAMIEQRMIGCRDFVDPDSQTWENYCVAFAQAYAGISLFPMVHKQTAKFALPTVIVDGIDVNSFYREEIEEVDPGQIPDRIVTNVVNTSTGVTRTRRSRTHSAGTHSSIRRILAI